MSSSAITVSESSRKGSKMGSSTKHPSSAISEHSSMRGTPTHIREWLMSLQQDFHASRFQSPESEQEETTAETCGPKHLPSFAQYDRDTRCWKTCQVCLLTNMPDEYSETWPKTGLMLNGVCYPQPNAERRISAIGSGFIATPTAKANQLSPSMMKHASCRKMLPTPSTVDDGAFFNTSLGAQAQPRPTLGAMAKHNLWPTPTTPTGGGERSKDRAGTGSLAYMARTGKLWPTPRSSPNENRQTKPTPSQLAGKHGRSLDWKGSSKAGQRRGQLTDPAMGAIPAGGQLNPTWVEWLMGWPLGWTDLRPLEMGKFQQWQQQHGIY
jgi:hypothetical protein